MKLALTLLFTFGLLSVSAAAQETAPQEAPKDGVPPVKMTEDEIKSFQKLLTDWVTEDLKSLEKRNMETTSMLKLRFGEMVRDFGQSHKRKIGEETVPGSPFQDVEAWQSIARNVGSIHLDSRPSGTGRIQEDRAIVETQGDVYIFEYAYRLPKAYKADRSWPVILCLHDKDSNGKEYLKSIWEDKKIGGDVADRYILVAPTIGDKTAKGKVDKVEAKIERLEWFTGFHARAILLPLVEIQKRFNCDPSRIYVDGCGTGGDAAAQLAALYGDKIAAVAVRSGYLRDPALAPGLFGVPSLFLMREKSKFTEGARKGSFDKIAEAAKSLGFADQIRVEVKPAPEKLTPKDMAGQVEDPILDACADIDAFFQSKSLPAHPQRVHITTNNRIFVSRAWLKLEKFEENANSIADIDATVDRATNTVTVNCKEVFEFKLNLNDTLVDLDKPVHVLVNGNEAASRTVDRSPEMVWRQIAVQNPVAANRLVMGSLVVAVPEPPEEKKPEAGEGEKAPEGGK